MVQRMSLGDGFDIQEVFESALTIVKNLPKEGPIKPSDDLKLKLYAYYKQATHGPNDTPKPRFYQIVEAYKWDAWTKLGDMSREEAMLSYIRELKKIMDSIPRDETDIDEDNRHYEEVLGKKFYDYWFNQWNQRPAEQLTYSQSSQGASSSSQMVSCSSTQPQQIFKGNTSPTNNDTQSNSSSGDSSVSMLDDTSQAAAAYEAEQAGYKTPTSLSQLQVGITGQMSDQFAQAILRLEHNLTDTTSRLGRLEEQLSQSLVMIRSLELSFSQQTFPKQIQSKTTTVSSSSGSRRGQFYHIFSQISTVHWFYLSYPVLVYILMRLFFDRRSRWRREEVSRSLR